MREDKDAAGSEHDRKGNSDASETLGDQEANRTEDSIARLCALAGD
jgi:hypothetical protein